MNSNAEWRRWGESDPLWAVDSTGGRRRGTANDWEHDLAAFLERGREYFASVRPMWAAYGMGSERCVEIGCGAGRLTNQLLDDFDRIVAIDVSPHQIDKSRELLGPRSARVEYHVVDEPRIPVAAGSCDGVFSAEVFQHFSDYGMIDAYVRAAFSALRPGGTMAFQVPVMGIHPRRPLAPVRDRALAFARGLGWRRMMEYRYVSAPKVFASLSSAGFADAQLRVFSVGGHEGIGHAYFFARHE